MVAMLTVLIVVIVLQLYTYVKKTLHLKCVQLIVNYLCVNKAILKVALKSYALALVKHLPNALIKGFPSYSYVHKSISIMEY